MLIAKRSSLVVELEAMDAGDDAAEVEVDGLDGRGQNGDYHLHGR